MGSRAFGPLRRSLQSPVAETRFYTPTATTAINKPTNSTSLTGKNAGVETGSVSVGVAITVPTSSYVPSKPPLRSSNNRPKIGNYAHHDPTLMLKSPSQQVPPPVPPRTNVRLCVSFPSDGSNTATTTTTMNSGPFLKPMQRPYREPPLLEESDSLDKSIEALSSGEGSSHNRYPLMKSNATKHTSTSSSTSSAGSNGNNHGDDEVDSDEVENSRSGMLACVSNANDTSIESLVLEETALLLPSAPSGRPLIRNATECDENTLI